MNLHDSSGGPKNGVTMEVFGRVKPDVISFFSASAGAAIAIHVCLKPPRLSSYVT